MNFFMKHLHLNVLLDIQYKIIETEKKMSIKKCQFFSNEKIYQKKIPTNNSPDVRV